MPRWRIVRTLLYKEALRFRYNWGLLILIGAVIGMSSMVTISANMTKGIMANPVQVVRQAVVYHDRNSSWADYLRAHLPGSDLQVEFKEIITANRQYPPLRDQTISVMLVPPRGKQGNYLISMRYEPKTAASSIPIRAWAVKETRAFARSTPAIDEDDTVSVEAADRVEVVSVVITALVMFALYLISFNLYINSTGEEREKKVLLAVLLSPASPLEVIVAKALFYGAISIAVAACIVGMHQPQALLRPRFWTTIISSSVGYVSVGTVVICLVKRQSTLSMIGLLYMVVTALVFSLGQTLILFAIVANLQFEYYLNRQLQNLLTDGSFPSHRLEQFALWILVCCWAFVAQYMFRIRGMALSRGG